MRWIPFAMVRIVAVFMAGILLAIYGKDVLELRWIIILFTFSILAYFLMRWIFDGSRLLKFMTGLAGIFSILLSGYLTVLIRTESTSDDHLLHVPKNIIAYKAKLISPAEEKKKSLKRVALVQEVRTDSGWLHCTGKIILYWPKNEKIVDLHYGDILLIKGQPQEINAPFNPEEFDFKEFQKFRNIYHQQFIRAGTWLLMEHSRDRGFLFYAGRARTWSVNALKKYISSPRERAIVTALVLGVTDGLDDELLNAYSATGAMHVLAVSGLHVSIIYGLLLLLLKPLNKGEGGKWVIACISLFILWGYAFITGLSPSVLRAVTMFTFVALAKPMGRNNNVYNTLAASAFFLLLYDPFLIMSVGFQLSYLAVWGIVYLQRPLYNLWEPKSPLMNWAWQLTTVSIAAQIATFALGLLYFHQFPVYFLLSNLFVIPGSFVVLLGGILLLIVSPFSWVSGWIGLGLELFVRLLNEGIFLIERLPFSLISDVYISPLQCLLLFMFSAGILILFQFKNFLALIMASISALGFGFLSWHHYKEVIQNPQFTLYRIPRHYALELTSGMRAFVHLDSSFEADVSGIRFHLRPNRLRNRVTHVEAVPGSLQRSLQGLRFFVLGERTILYLQEKKFRLPDEVDVDYLVIGNNAVASIHSLEGKIRFKNLIFDSSNSLRYCERLGKEASLLNKDYYSVLAEGAFTLNL